MTWPAVQTSSIGVNPPAPRKPGTMPASLLTLTSSSPGNLCAATTVTDSGCGPPSPASTMPASAFTAA